MEAEVARGVGRAEEGERKARGRRMRREIGRRKEGEQAKGQREQVQVDAVASRGIRRRCGCGARVQRSRGKRDAHQRSLPRLWTRTWYEARGGSWGRQKEDRTHLSGTQSLLFERRSGVRSGGNWRYLCVRGVEGGPTCRSCARLYSVVILKLRIHVQLRESSHHVRRRVRGHDDFTLPHAAHCRLADWIL